MMAITQLNPIQDQNITKNSTPAKIIPINGKKTCHKRTHESTGNYAYSIEDMKKILDYFKENKKWIHYLCAAMSFNMAFRNTDILSLKWCDIFNPITGEFKNNIKYYEGKNRHVADVKINDAVKNAINLYIQKTGTDISKNNYNEFMFLKVSGRGKGKEVISYDGCRKALKGAAEKVGIEENSALHSFRRAFGKAAIDIHPNDPDNIRILQEIYGHSSSWITLGYTGITKKKTSKYYDDAGEVFDKYIAGEQPIPNNDGRAGTICIDSAELRNILKLAYEDGMENASIEDNSVHMDELNKLISMIEDISV